MTEDSETTRDAHGDDHGHDHLDSSPSPASHATTDTHAHTSQSSPPTPWASFSGLRERARSALDALRTWRDSETGTRLWEFADAMWRRFLHGPEHRAAAQGLRWLFGLALWGAAAACLAAALLLAPHPGEAVLWWLYCAACYVAAAARTRGRAAGWAAAALGLSLLWVAHAVTDPREEAWLAAGWTAAAASALEPRPILWAHALLRAAGVWGVALLGWVAAWAGLTAAVLRALGPVVARIDPPHAAVWDGMVQGTAWLVAAGASAAALRWVVRRGRGESA